MMTFNYSFSDPIISNFITVDIKKDQTVDNLIKIIASDLHIEKCLIKIKNPPNEKQLCSLPNEYTFQLGISLLRKDIPFFFPDGTNIIIKDCYKMTFNDVIKHFQDNFICFSTLFIKKNLHILKSGKDIPNIKFPFLGSLSKDKFEVQISGNFNTFNYDKYKFFLADKEHAWPSSNFIFSFFPEIKFPSNVKFSYASTGRILNGCDEIEYGKKYDIRIEYRFNFKHILRKSDCYQILDYFSKILDAKQRLAIILSNNNEIGPENIVIYDKNKNKIEDQNQYLKDIKDDIRIIYFDIEYESKHSALNNVQKTSFNSKSALNEIKSSSISKEPSSNLSLNKKEIESEPSLKSELISSKKEVKNEQKPLSCVNDPKSETKETNTKPPAKKKLKDVKPKTTQIAESPNPKSHKQPKKIEINDDSDTTEPESFITIHFIFEENSEEQFPPFTKKYEISTSINEIKEDIKKGYKIENRLSIEYKDGDNKTSVGNKMQIKDLIEDMKEEAEKGETKYVLYIKITEKSRSNQEKQIDLSKEVLHQQPDEDDINKNDDVIRKETNKKKKKPNKRDFIPIKKLIINSPPPPENKTKQEKHEFEFEFIFKDSEKRIKLDEDSYLEDNENKIRNKFGINKTQKLDFFKIKKGEDKDCENLIKSGVCQMKTLKDCTIKICRQDKPEEYHMSNNSNDDDDDDVIIDENQKPNHSDSESIKEKDKEEVKSGMHKYYYQTNKMEEIQEIELNAGIDVKELKRIIAEKNYVDDLANIKVIFAGKDLLNDLVLDDLEIEDIPLYIYIRSIEDILLMTAKALVVKKEDLENEEEEEND